MTPLSWTLMWKTKWEKRSTLPQPRISLIWLVYSAYTPWWTRNNTIRPNQKNGLTDQIPLLDGAVWTIFKQNSKFEFKSIKALGFICICFPWPRKCLQFENEKKTSLKRFLASKGYVGNWIFSKLGTFWEIAFLDFFGIFLRKFFGFFLDIFLGEWRRKEEEEGR